jgi:peptidoglycan/LPS O-acetylase OafA/YrhL
MGLPFASDALGQVLQYGSALERTFVVLSNVFLFGLDLTHFMHVTPAGGIARGYGEISGAFLILLRPAWSLAVELGFYVLAPFLLVRRTRVLVAFIVASIAFRVALSFVDPRWHGFSDTWNGVLPSEIATFLAGSLGYRFYSAAADRSYLAKTGPRMLALIALYVVLYRLMGGRSEGPRLMVAYFGFVVLVAWTVPFIFAWSRERALDRFIGELSYPVYLSHVVVFEALTSFGITGGWRAAGTLAMSLVLAALLVVSVDRPLQRFRAVRYGSRAPSGAPDVDAMPARATA